MTDRDKQAELRRRVPRSRAGSQQNSFRYACWHMRGASESVGEIILIATAIIRKSYPTFMPIVFE